MKKLVSSSEAAQILGLSLQGIHYRIKKGQLESIKKDGKIFVYVDSKTTSNSNTNTAKLNHTQNDDRLIEVKDEQIKLLKKTIKFLKKQKDSEIVRLERQQEKIMDVFQSEVDLLKSAFNEMRTLYKVSHKSETITNKKNTKDMEEEPKVESKVDFDFMDIKEFFIFMKNHNKTDSQIKTIILDKIKHGDKRFLYNKKTKDVIIYKSDFLDLI
ncbi:MAG: DNA-binding protein [Campylobacterota bacterium]|nr:DNA-binding protein [Campylobacterota bacterium]